MAVFSFYILSASFQGERTTKKKIMRKFDYKFPINFFTDIGFVCFNLIYNFIIFYSFFFLIFSCFIIIVYKKQRTPTMKTVFFSSFIFFYSSALNLLLNFKLQYRKQFGFLNSRDQNSAIC